jgi:hypothetical protein
VDVKGRRLWQAAEEGDTVGLCEIAPSAADDKQVTPRNHLFRDRRAEMYGT